ncbi:MAG: Ig-like domain-containing protein [Bacteroidales bacterium]|nr:Ig-like domain-containing protein [Bacteroidales bacterium]
MKKIFTFWMMALWSVVSLGQDLVEYIYIEDGPFLELALGQSQYFGATFVTHSDNPSQYEFPPAFYFESFDPNIVEVTNLTQIGDRGKCLIRGISEGSTFIRVYCSNGLVSDCEVTVRWIEVESISVTPYLELEEGESQLITTQITPVVVSNPTVLFVVDDNDTDVITVNQDGLVTGQNAGTATVIAMTSNGLEARCEVVVRGPLSPIIGSGKIHISGTVFFDENENGIQDGEEYGLPQQKLLILPDSVYAQTDNAGKYSFSCGEETVYQIIPQLSDNWKLTTETTSNGLKSGALPMTEVSLGKTNVSGIDFGIKNIKDERKPEISIISLDAGVCFEDFQMFLFFKNKGTAVEQGCIQLDIDPRFEYVFSTSLKFDSISVDSKTMYWNIGDIRPFEQKWIRLTLEMPSRLNDNDLLESVVLYKDAESVLCSDTTNIENLCSFDPNDKTVFPMGVTDENLVLMNEPLSYTIRFQNTGNYYAKNVVVIDTLSSALDLETFEVVAASHNLKTNYTSDGVVEFRFDDIMLLDSTTNEPESHGFVKYRIKAKRDLPDNTVIENTAHIFFDYNPAVVTNTTMNTLTYTILKNEESTAIEIPYDATVKLYPNPISDYAVLEFDNAGNDLFQLTISDVTGKVVNTMQTSGNSFVVGKGLGKGVYLYSLKNTQTNQVYRNSFLVE